MPLLTQSLDAAALVEARKQAGMSQAELAQAVGVTTTAIRHYEHERRSVPRGDVLVRLSSTLGVEPCDLLRPPSS